MLPLVPMSACLGVRRFLGPSVVVLGAIITEVATRIAFSTDSITLLVAAELDAGMVFVGAYLIQEFHYRRVRAATTGVHGQARCARSPLTWTLSAPTPGPSELDDA